MDTPNTFENRKQLWAQRRNLNKTNSSNRLPDQEKDISQQSQGNLDFDLHYRKQTETEDTSERVYSSGYFNESILEYLEASQICPNCLDPDTQNFDFVVDKSDQHILGKHCKKCDVFIGVDDTVSIHSIEEILKKFQAPLCSNCPNRDLNQYTLQQDAQTGSLYVICNACKTTVKNSQQSPQLLCDITQEPENLPDTSKITCYCGNNDFSKFKIEFNEEINSIMYITCMECYLSINYLNPVDELPQAKHISEEYSFDESKVHLSTPCGKINITHAKELKPGDHVCFWRTLKWEHHLIIEKVYPDKNEVDVLNYYPPDGKGPKAEVVRTRINFEKDIGQGKPAEGIPYKITYSGPCYPADIVIERALSRIGETKYNFLLHNCEHFAQWCKTGAKGVLESKQVCCLITALKHMGEKVSAMLAKDLVKASLVTMVLENATKSAVQAETVAGNVAAEFAGEVATLGLSEVAALTAAGVAVVAGIEIYRTVKDIKKYKKEKENRKYDDSTYKNEVVGRVSKCVFKIGGMAGGTIAGNVAGGAIAGALACGSMGNFVCPVVGGFIGATLGVILGFAIGHAVKFAHAKYQNRQAKDQNWKQA